MRKALPIAILSEGQLFGEEQLLSPLKTRQSTAKVISQSAYLYVLNIKDLFKIIRKRNEDPNQFIIQYEFEINRNKILSRQNQLNVNIQINKKYHHFNQNLAKEKTKQPKPYNFPIPKSKSRNSSHHQSLVFSENSTTIEQAESVDKKDTLPQKPAAQRKNDKSSLEINESQINLYTITPKKLMTLPDTCADELSRN